MIHPTAIVEPGARLAANVAVGAYSMIGAQVEVGEGTVVGPHVVIEGRTRIGRNNRIFQFASLGGVPQDKKYAGEDTSVEIGDDNWIMAYAHFAHDCLIGSHTIVANACQLAGHVHVGDWAILGATTLVHQFVHIGAHSFTGMGTYLDRDLPPYVGAAGNRAQPYGINTVGLRRRGLPGATIDALKRAYRTIYRSGLGQEEVRRELEAQAAACAELRVMIDFLDASKRGIVR
jgi:UDP-N-acetylglucosamine acyltransferase